MISNLRRVARKAAAVKGIGAEAVSLARTPLGLRNNIGRTVVTP